MDTNLYKIGVALSVMKLFSLYKVRGVVSRQTSTKSRLNQCVELVQQSLRESSTLLLHILQK